MLKLCMKNGKWGPMKGSQHVNDISRGKQGKKMRGWRSITPSDGVADWCCLAIAELLKVVIDGWLVCRAMFILSLICIFVCICRAVGFCWRGSVPVLI